MINIGSQCIAYCTHTSNVLSHKQNLCHLGWLIVQTGTTSHQCSGNATTCVTKMKATTHQKPICASSLREVIMLLISSLTCGFSWGSLVMTRMFSDGIFWPLFFWTNHTLSCDFQSFLFNYWVIFGLQGWNFIHFWLQFPQANNGQTQRIHLGKDVGALTWQRTFLILNRSWLELTPNSFGTRNWVFKKHKFIRSVQSGVFQAPGEHWKNYWHQSPVKIMIGGFCIYVPILVRFKQQIAQPNFNLAITKTLQNQWMPSQNDNHQSVSSVQTSLVSHGYHYRFCFLPTHWIRKVCQLDVSGAKIRCSKPNSRDQETGPGISVNVVSASNWHPKIGWTAGPKHDAN